MSNAEESSKRRVTITLNCWQVQRIQKLLETGLWGANFAETVKRLVDDGLIQWSGPGKREAAS